LHGRDRGILSASQLRTHRFEMTRQLLAQPFGASQHSALVIFLDPPLSGHCQG